MPGAMRKIIYSLIIVSLLLSMMGCSVSNILPESEYDNFDSNTEEEVDVPTKSDLPSKGGQIRIPIAQADNINPLLTRSVDFINLYSLIYESLFTYDENLNLVPLLVESWEVLDDGKLWQFQLRKDVKWHDGREFTAKDVKHTFDLLFNEFQQLEEGEAESSYAKRLFSGRDIARMEFVVNNPYAVTIVLNQPAGLTLMEALTFPILPETEGERTLKLNDINSLIGTGPYMIDSGSLEADDQINLIRNDGWWGKPQPYIDTITAHIYKNNEESLYAFKNNEVDLVDTHVIYAESYGMKGQAQLYRYLTQDFNYIGINHKKSGVLGDKKVREAIAYAMDRKDIISRVYSNNAQAVDVPIPPDAWYYDSDLRVFDYQPIKAQQLLEEAGWKDSDGDGILDKKDEGKNVNLSFTINANMDNIMQKEALNLIIEQLTEIGIDVKVRYLSWDDYIKALEEGDFEAVFAEYFMDLPIDLRFMFNSSEIGNGLNNYMGYRSEELDDLLESVTEIQDPQEFKDTYRKIQRHLIEELPIISLYYRTSSMVASQKIHGIKAPRELMIFRNIREWYLEQ